MEIFKKEKPVFERSFVSSDSLKVLNNPFCGGYHLHYFELGQKDIDPEIELIRSQSDVTLQLIEIGLGRYAEKQIDEEGLKELRDIFAKLKELPFQLIVRFLYDTDGHALMHEPDHITIIYEHMKQLKPVIEDYAGCIYIMQGLFIGNWGEMNGSKFLGPSYLASLALKMKELTGERIFLAVRTPSQRRILEKNKVDVSRVSLFNDGLLGTDRDLGTYGILKKQMCEYTDQWHRDDELEYQHEICLKVPNGGEIVGDNSNSDLKNTLQHLTTARISYLNLDYDQKTYRKWEKIENIDNWPNLKEYVLAHLGYRFIVTDCEIKRDFLRKKINVTVKIRNDGFAPAYFPLRFVLSCGEKEREVKVEGDHFEKDEGGNLVFGFSLDELEKDSEVKLRAFILDREISFANTNSDQKILILGNIKNNA